MKQPRPVTIDFETWGIEGRPDYPPKPCGVSIQYPGKRPTYYAFGHVRGNTCTHAYAKRELKRAYDHPDGILFQNAKFDVDVAETFFGLTVPHWQRIHDTLFLLFLDDPNQTELSLKPSATRLLGMPPDEQDEVVEWLVKHQPVDGVKISASKQSPTYAMKYVPHAPVPIVGRYANGDVDRTTKIFNLLWKRIVDRGMLDAYNRERQLMPILLRMERQGVNTDIRRLERDAKQYHQWWQLLDGWIFKTLRTEPFNINSGDELIRALLDAKKIDRSKVPFTKTGKLQTNKDVLTAAITDRTLLGALNYRSQLKTFLGTFMDPWLAVARRSNGLIYTTWNQVKSPKGDDNVGTRTGRLSSTPNFQNIPKETKPHFAQHCTDSKLRKTLPNCPVKGLPDLPLIRSYIAPFKGEWLVDRDYSQQEPRILAHFDGGALMQKYLDDPWVDFHDYAKDELAKMGLFYERRPVKNTNLGLIYGMGAGKLAIKNGMDVTESANLKRAILKLYPGLKDMYRDMRERAKNKQPIRTWGGREYYCEPPKFVGGRLKEYDYKMVNTLIQGSAADCTKEAIIRFDTQSIMEGMRDKWKLILNVHDQLTVSAPPASRFRAMEVLRTTMESVEFDVPMLSEGSFSKTNWSELKDFDKKGKRCHG